MASKLPHSLFKNINLIPYKNEKCMQNIKFAAGGVSESTICDVSGKFIAIIIESSGGGNFLVINLEEFGRIELNHPKVRAHTATVTDIKWSPFGDNKIASCSDDCTVKCWIIPDGGLPKDLDQCVGEECRATKKITNINWHPTVDDIIAGICHDMNVYIWRIDNGEQLYKLRHENYIYNCAWNIDGSLLATTCKDKYIRSWDVQKEETLIEILGHKGSKAAHVCFAGLFNLLITTGFSKDQQREISVWVSKDQATTMSLDPSSAVLFPFYDEGTHVLSVIGKGDTTIRFYEIYGNEPYIQFLTLSQTTEPMKGFGLLPKSDVDFMSCEISRIYKLLGKGSLQPNALIVPRKAAGFQNDIFQTCFAKEPSLLIDEWISGNTKLLPRVREFSSRLPDSRTSDPKSFFLENMRPFCEIYLLAKLPIKTEPKSVHISGQFDNFDELLARYRSQCKDMESLRAKIESQSKEIKDLQDQVDQLKKE